MNLNEHAGSWADERTLSPKQLRSVTGFDQAFVRDSIKRGQFHPSSRLSYSPRDVGRLLVLSDALASSVHLRRGPRNGKNAALLKEILRAFDTALDEMVKNGSTPLERFVVPRANSPSRVTVTFDFREVIERYVLPLAPLGERAGPESRQD